MLIRSTNYLLAFTFLANKSFGAEEGGMPQLNPEFWVSQIFWLTIVFSFLFIILSKMILPKISENLESRKLKVLENLEQAEKFREKSKEKISEYQKILVEAKNEAKIIMNKTKEKINEDINIKKDQLDKEIEKEILSIEKEIKLLKEESIKDINKIAIETSSDIIKSIMNIEINKSNVSAIVEDVTKKRIKEHLW